MSPTGYLWAGIAAVLLGLGLWIEALRVEVSQQQGQIVQYQAATKLAKQEVLDAQAADAAKAKEISDANDQQVGSMARYISALLLQHANVPSAPASQAPATPVAAIEPLGQPSGCDHPSTDGQVVQSRSDAAAVLGVAIEGWSQVKLWREWANEAR